MENYSFLFLISGVVLTFILESFISRKFFKTKAYNFKTSFVSASLGLSAFLTGIFFSAIHLSVYNYIELKLGIFEFTTTNVVNWLVAILLYDLLYYICHYSHHKISFLWSNHVVHHSGEDFNFLLAVRIGLAGTLTVWLFFLPMALLGVPLSLYLVVITMQLAYQYAIHTKLVPELGIIEKVMVTPSQHRVHHAKNPEYIDKNLGCFFVIWDRLFGTYQKELCHIDIEYGVKGYSNTYLPDMVNINGYLNLLRFNTKNSAQRNVREGTISNEIFNTALSFLASILIACYIIIYFELLPSASIAFYFISMLATLNISGAILRGTSHVFLWHSLKALLPITASVHMIASQPSYLVLPGIILILSTLAGINAYLTDRQPKFLSH